MKQSRYGVFRDAILGAHGIKPWDHDIKEKAAMLYTDEQARDLIKQTRIQHPVTTSNGGSKMTQLMAALSERLPKKYKTVRRITWGAFSQEGEVLPIAHVASFISNLVMEKRATNIVISNQYEITDDE